MEPGGGFGIGDRERLDDRTEGEDLTTEPALHRHHVRRSW